MLKKMLALAAAPTIGKPMFRKSFPLRAAILSFLLIGFIHYLGSFEQSAKEAISQPTFEYTMEKNVMIPMRDGTRLAADIYKPVGRGPFPAILLRTPYNKSRPSYSEYGDYYASRGYVVVVQDIRGRFASEGNFEHSANDGWGKLQDGYDTVEWIGTQPWCNGNVGTFGISHSGHVQYLLAPTRPPHLKAMFVGCAPSNFYNEMRYNDGALLGQTIQWMQQNGATGRVLDTIEDWAGWLQLQDGTALTFFRSILSPSLLKPLDHPMYDEYWRQISFREKWNQVDVPIYHHSGWYDRYPFAAIENFNGVRKHGMTERARASQKLIIGPWPHTDRGIRKVGDIDFGPEAEVDINELRLRWFDYWLKGIDNGIMKEPPIRIFVMGENRWRLEKEWPLPQTKYTDFYLRAGNGKPKYSLNDGLLSTEPPPAAEKPDSFIFDPLKPLPTIGGDTRFGEHGAKDQRPVEKLSLTYTTLPLENDLEVTGPIVANLYVSSTAVDTDFTVMITDVHPDGYSQILRNNILRAKFRESLERPFLMKPGQVYKLSIRVYPISNVFKKGHRIRIAISSSSFPKWIPNTNSGVEFGKDTKIIKAVNTVYHDSRYPSHVVLPIIPRDE